jgi:site-specific recombinase XerD
VEFFTANIRNAHTREAYARAVNRFALWCDDRKLRLEDLNPPLVAAYVEQLMKELATPSVKQHLAAIRMLCDFLVVGHGLAFNPAASVRGPKHVVHRGKTPVLQPEQASQLLASIGTTKLVDLRDRALIAAMVFSFGRVSAVLGMNVGNFFSDGKRFWFRLHEKGGKHHEVPVHHKTEKYLDAYIAASGIRHQPRTPLFRSITRSGEVTERRYTRQEALKMVKRRARAANLPDRIGNHTFRATGITAYLLNGGTLEHAQQIAAHSSPRTTKLYDRTSDEISFDEIERILI